MPKIFCIYRADCADALGAAWGVHKALGPEVEFVKAKPGDRVIGYRGSLPIAEGLPECIIGRDLLILGHLYPLEVLRAMAKEARSVLVIAGSAEVQEDLQDISNYYALYGENGYAGYRLKAHYAPHALSAILDQSCSTAGLTWDYLHSNKQPHCDCGDSGICKMECPRYEQKMRAQPPRPHPINLIEDWFLGQFKYGDETRAFHAVLASYDWTNLPGMFKRLDEWYCYSDMVAVGTFNEPEALGEGKK